MPADIDFLPDTQEKSDIDFVADERPQSASGIDFIADPAKPTDTPKVSTNIIQSAIQSQEPPKPASVEVQKPPVNDSLRQLLGEDVKQVDIPKDITPWEAAATEAVKASGILGQILTGKPALSPGEEAAIAKHPVAKTIGDIFGGMAKPLALSAIPGVGLPVAFGAAGALDAAQGMAERSQDPNFQPTVPQIAGKEALGGIGGAITGKIFGASTTGKILGAQLPETVAGRIAEKGAGLASTQLATDLASQAAEGKAPDVKQAAMNAAINTATYGLVAGALSIPELRQNIVDEGSRIAGKPMAFEDAKKVVQDAGINPENLSPDFITQAYNARRSNFEQNTLKPMMQKYGASEDVVKSVLQGQDLNARDAGLTKWMTDLVKLDPEKAASLLPYFNQIKAGADPVDVLMSVDLQNKILGPLQSKFVQMADQPKDTGIETPEAAAIDKLQMPVADQQKSIIAQVRALGGIDPAKAALAGYPSQTFQQNGLFHILRTGGQSPDDIAKSLQDNNVMSVKGSESPTDALMASLKGDQSRLLQIADKMDNEYEAEYNQWLKENQTHAISIPAEAISSFTADLEKEIASEKNPVFSDWDEPAPAASTAARPAITAPGSAPAGAAVNENITPSGQVRPELLPPEKKSLFQEEGELFKSPQAKLNSESGQALNPIDTAAQASKEIIATLSPRTLTPRKSLDVIMTMKGQRDQTEFVLEQKMMDLSKAFDKIPQTEQIDFVDRIKTGVPQKTPALTKIAGMMRAIEDQYWHEAKQYKPSLAYLENHFRVMWKTIPGSTTAGTGFKGIFRRPLQGSKGFMKQHTLKDMSEGLSQGGIPYSYNPIVMWQNAIMDMQKYITAQRMWKAMKDLGQVQFVKFGKKAPPNFVQLDDGIAHVYFPTDAGMVDAGKWYVEEGAGRILGNFIGKDWIRNSAIGGSLLAFKNVTTSIELSLSPFHGAYTSLMASSSSIGLGLQKIWNLGIKMGKPGYVVSGLKDILSGFLGAAPLQYASLGGKAIKYVGKDNFINTKAGQDFIKAFPDAEHLLEMLFIGGGKLAIHQDYKTNSLKTFKDGLKNYDAAALEYKAAKTDAERQTAINKLYDNEAAVILNVIPGVNELIMKPLFEIYIPRLKIAAFLKEMSAELVARESQLKSGRLTEPQLAREVWDSVERRFGEMNFDNLFWDRNLKTTLQLAFRSVTWKMGAIQNIGGAGTGTVKELMAAVQDRTVPLLNRNLAFLLGVALLVALFSEVFQRLMIGEEPKDLKDIMDPRYDKAGNRIFLNTHLKDWAHLFHSPGGFISNSASGFIGRVLEDWNNKDFYNVEIHHPGDPAIKQASDLFLHLIPEPFIFGNQGNLKLESAPTAVKVLAGAGLITPAPGYVNKSPALQEAEELRSNNMPAGTRTKEQFAHGQLVTKFAQQYAKDGKQSTLDEGVAEGTITQKQANNIVNDAGKDSLQKAVKGLSYQQVANVMEKASKDEIKELMPIFLQKVDKKLDAALTGPTAIYKDMKEFKQKTIDRFKK